MARTTGVERERFITDKFTGKIIPAIGMLLPVVQKNAEKIGLSSNLFIHELFAGQIEDRTPVCNSLCELQNALIANDRILEESAKAIGLSFCFSEFVEENEMGILEVNPFDERHKKIWESISEDRRLAASRVIAVHVHVGVSPLEALKFFSNFNQNMITKLIELGDHSGGKRIASYRAMSQTGDSLPKFSTYESILSYIEKHGGEKNVWDLVRYKPSTQTIEFRMFGSTSKVEEVIKYTNACLELFV